ncbi:glycosyl hydrolase family 95 catalytic domain-containing protein [Neobacillus sp. NRS-1170]|uniref:glycosyl hydrolase family 95 catalytic domain-containing protein n=1 Tax=Neobacillus sp. NRS-1170 TaxID=3233898 RepID=UPI003D2C089C
MKYKNLLIGGLLSSTLLFSLGSPGVFVKAKETSPSSIETPKNEEKKLSLWYNQPAKNWETQALPIGNGYMGGMVFGGIQQEHIQFNEKTLWTGGPNSTGDYTYGNRDGAADHLDSIRGKLSKGDKSGAEKESSQFLTGLQDGFGDYQNFGDIYLDFNMPDQASFSNYRRELNLNEGIASVAYNYKDVHYTREYFASYPDHVMVMRLNASKSGQISLDVRPTSAQGGKISSIDNTITIRGQIANNGMKYEAEFKVLNEGGTLTSENGKIKVANADTLTIIMTAATDYENKYPDYKGKDSHQKIEEIMASISEKTYDSLKSTHIIDYQSLFNRVSLDLGGKEPSIPTNELLASYSNTNNKYLEELFFQYGRYLLIASSRPGTLPANLQGVWNNSNTPPWDSDYHFNINLQMNYWPAEVTNLSETALPLVNYVDSLREPGRVSAEKHFGVTGGGWTVNTMNNPFGFTAPGWGLGWGWAPSANAFISQNLWEHYKFTDDKEYLKEKIYPIIKEAAEFHSKFLVEDQNKKLVVSPCWSPEIGGISDGCAFDQQLVYELFSNVIEASEVLHTDEVFRAELKAKRDQLFPPIQIGRYGQVQEWKDDIDDPAETHRHISQLVALYPGSMINHNTPEWLNAAKVTLNHRGDEGTGWSKANKINLWARLLDGEHAYKILQGQLTGSTLSNLFDTHPPFQIDGNFGATSGIAEMLIQSHTESIQILPALPKAWKDGSYKGLKARGAFTIDTNWKNGVPAVIHLTSDHGNDAKLKSPMFNAPFTLTRIGDNKKMKFTKDGDTISFKTQPGKTYKIESLLNFDLESTNSVTAGNTVKVKVHLSNPGTLESPSGEVIVKAPEGWNVKPFKVAFEGIEPGESKTVEADLSVPIDTVSNNYSIEAELSTGNGTISKSNQIEVTPAVKLISTNVEPNPISVEGGSTTLNVRVQNELTETVTPGKIELQLPDGWNAQPSTKDFQLPAGGEETYSFVVSPPTNFKGMKEVGVSVILGNSVVTSAKVQVVSGGVYLSDIPWVKATVGWATIQIDKSIDGNPLSLLKTTGPMTFNKGIGTHAKSEITYDISNSNYKRFNSYVGIDHETGGNGGSVVFKVLLDGVEEFNSGTMYYNTPAKFVDVDLTGKKELTLVVGDAGNGNGNDHADWADAWLSNK